jgi:transcriptional regulator with XRE-family HTH domain
MSNYYYSLAIFVWINTIKMSQLNTLGSRIMELRKKKEWSQTDLANKVNVSYAQIGRYETKNAQPPAVVLQKIANALETTVDFLLNGDSEDKAKASLHDAEVIRYFKEVDTLPQDDKSALLRVIGGFLRDVKTKKAYAS